jgi:hypothetical protein
MSKNIPLLGSKNIKNLDSMVAAGIITRAQADKQKAKAAAKKKKSMLRGD